ncbi:MAG TPA: 1-acyl-sn-glycerol-3-phosphate acyltransferase [Euryarchaeota archaeon]|nr:MAG: 1-acyl-sn-glycerol-3-phosphate acyltransferase [Thermoplasmatales archaeon ex4484_6]HHD15352.1 1-acyl-sn-glycerol-3-phosphate acyltransferase [Euryarchaeota archaeon]
MSWLYYLAWPIVAPIFKTMFLCWKVEGKENMVKKGAIFAANHVSNAEGPILNALRYRPVRFLGKEELFHKPFSRIILKGVGTIPIKRGKSDKIAFEKALLALKRGNWIGIFPEGTRGNGRELGDPHTGAIRLAMLADVPIVPVGFSGGTKAWPKGGWPKPFRKVNVRIGPPWKVPRPEDGREPTYAELKELARYLMFELIQPLVDFDLDK